MHWLQAPPGKLFRPLISPENLPLLLAVGDPSNYVTAFDPLQQLIVLLNSWRIWEPLGFEDALLYHSIIPPNWITLFQNRNLEFHQY